MKGFARLLAAEMRKYAHTPVLKIHLVLPLVGMAVFLLYYSFSGWSSAGKVQAYLEVVACIWPFLTGLVCGMAAEMEAEAGYQILLLLPPGRCRGITAKWLGLLILGLGAVLLAILGFGILYRLLLPGGDVFSLDLYVREALVIWLGQIPVYLIHLFLSIRLGKAASISAGAGGMILACLMLTGMGEGIWMYLPWAFSGRWCDYVLVYHMSVMDSAAVAEQAFWPFCVCGGLSLLIFGTVLLWYRKKDF